MQWAGQNLIMGMEYIKFYGALAKLYISEFNKYWYGCIDQSLIYDAVTIPILILIIFF